MPIYCPHCNAELPAGAGFCPVCGKPLQADSTRAAQGAPVEVVCPRCSSHYNPPIPPFCQQCGYPVGSAAGQTITHKPETAQQVPAETKTGERGCPSAGLKPGLPKKSKPEPSQQAAGSSRLVRRVALFLGGLIIIGGALITGWYLWQNLQPASTGLEKIDPCTPVKPDENFEAANLSNLQGEIRQDSYFQGGEDYTIAAGASLIIPQGVTLIIEPGARLKFGEGSKMVVEGKLLACGRNNRPILFTADTTSGRPGFWHGVEFRNADVETVIGHASFEYAGREGHAPIWVEGTDIHLEDVRFDSNQWYALSLDPDSFPRLRPPFEVENGLRGWEVRGGQMKKSMRWIAEQTFIVNGLLEINEDASLSLPAGLQMSFRSDSALRVYGELAALGEASQQIVFTSVNDVPEESLPDPASGDWLGVQIVGRKSKVTLQNVEIRYAGGEGRERGCLWLSDASPVLRNVNIRHCATYSVSSDLASDAQIEELNLEEQELTRRWEMRQSSLSGVTQRTINLLTEADGTPIYPIVTGWVGAEKDATLIINPGVVLLFSGGNQAGLWADGKIQINGEAKKPVLLTSWRDAQFNPAGGAAPGDWGGLHLNNSKPEEVILNQTILRYGGAAENTCLLLRSASPVIRGLQIADCVAYPLSSDAVSRPQMDNIDLSSNQRANQWEIRESTLKERAAWEWSPFQSLDGTQVIRYVTGVVTIDPEATLSLKPGVIVKFASGKGLIARGSLSIEGTENQPVLLTSWRDPQGGGTESDPQPGDWGGLVLEGSQAVKKLSYLSIHYAGIPNNGVGCLNLKESNPTIESVEIKNCSYYPVTSDLASDPAVESLALQDNHPTNDWAMRESSLPKGLQRTWERLSQADGSQLQRIVTGWLTIESGASLEIKAGQIIKFQNDVGVHVRGGRLIVLGASDQKVIFTSWRDPQVSNEGGVQSGDWAGLLLEAVSSDTQLSQLEVRFAGSNRNPRGAIVLSEGSPQLENLMVTDSAWYPVSVDLLSNPAVQKVTFSNNLPSNAIEVRGSKLDSVGEQIWSPWYDASDQPLVRVVMNTLTIGEQATLKVEEGVVVKFEPNAALDIYGSLLVNGAIFTSLHDDNTLGDSDGDTSGEPTWQGVMLHGLKPIQLTNTTLSFGRYGLWLENAAPLLTSVHIVGSWEAALSSDFSSQPQVDGITLEENALNGILLREDRLPDGEISWELIGQSENQLVRVIDKMVTIGPATQLRVAPGTVVKFTETGGLSVEGQLVAGASGGERVYFTALADDSAGGDTDLIQQSPRRGSWNGLVVNPNRTDAQLSLFSMDIRYAINGLALIDMPEWNFDGLTISASQFYGISCNTLSIFDPTNPAVTLLDNGVETISCPTPDQAEVVP